MNKYYLNRIPHSIVFAKTLDSLFENHKINFDGKRAGSGTTRHTSLDWFLSPVERPSIDKAEAKENYIDIPGTNGGLDLTESLTGFPLYKYIEGSFEFKVLNDRKLPTINSKCELQSEQDISWDYLNRDIRTFLNGKELYMMLEDDPSLYYFGRFTVERYDASESANSKITITYKVYPYKRLCKEAKELETYFDAQPLRDDDTNKLMISFWDKKSFTLKDVSSSSHSILNVPISRTSLEIAASIAGTASLKDEYSLNLNFDNDVSQLIFQIEKRTAAHRVYANLKTYEDNVLKREMENEIPAEIDPTGQTESQVKVRGFVLTNNYHYNSNGAYNSDNVLTIDVRFPNNIITGSKYSKGDVVYYNSSVTGQTDIKWILKANTDIGIGWTTMDFTKWDVDTLAMNVELYSSSSAYSAGDLIYKIESDDLKMYKALESIAAESEWDATKWTDTIDISADGVYKSISLGLTYDIGVM